MFCPKCGAQIPDGSAFCIKCGAKINTPVNDSQPVDNNPQPVERTPRPAVNNARPAASRAQSSHKKSDGMPAWAIIVSAAMVVAAIAVVVIVLATSKTDDKKETEAQEVAVVETEKATVEETKAEEPTEAETEPETEFETEEETKPEEEEYIIKETDSNAAPDKGKWKQDNKGWWYDAGDDYYAAGIYRIGLYYYGFNDEGYMLTGWNKTNSDDWYYFYDDGKMAINEWVDDHFLGSDGIMVKNMWVGDSFVDEEGKWVPDKKKGNVKPASNDSSSGDMDSIAAKLSTSDVGTVADFNWFLDIEVLGGNDAGQVISKAERITGDENPLLNGGWKGYLVDTISKPFTPEVERYFNVEVDTSGKKFNGTVNWSVFYDLVNMKAHDDNFTDDFEGDWDAASGTATVMLPSGKIEFDNFWISSDKKAEYATGTFYWISGEKERIGLIREID